MTDEIDEPLGDEEPWLTIVGIGDNGLSSVTPEALPYIWQAERSSSPNGSTPYWKACRRRR